MSNKLAAPTTPVLGAEYRYDGRNHRTMWRNPQRATRSGAGTTQGPYIAIYLDRWHYADRISLPLIASTTAHGATWSR